MSKRDPLAAFEDMRDAIDTIEHYVQGYSFEQYMNDRKTQDAVVRNFEILGEAASFVPEEVRSTIPDIPWKRGIGLRNVVIHHYFAIQPSGLSSRNNFPRSAHRLSISSRHDPDR